jgi:CubicO group peptidase (beta-lactamase class C family)
MNSTSFYLTPELKERVATLSFKQPDGSWVPWANQFPVQEHDPKKVHVFTGGIGLLSTGRDYLTLQRHILQVLAGTATNPIIKKDNLQLFFEPSLTPEGEDAMNAMLQSPGHQHGLGLGVEINDQGPARRKAGTGYWSGWAGTTHYIDPKAGVAVYGGVQVTLPPQFQVILAWEDIHPVLYKGLGIN